MKAHMMPLYQDVIAIASFFLLYKPPQIHRFTMIYIFDMKDETEPVRKKQTMKPTCPTPNMLNVGLKKENC